MLTYGNNFGLALGYYIRRGNLLSNEIYLDLSAKGESYYSLTEGGVSALSVRTFTLSMNFPNYT